MSLNKLKEVSKEQDIHTRMNWGNRNTGENIPTKCKRKVMII